MNDFVVSAGSERIVHVNGEDEILGSVSRQEMREQGLLHRVTYILVFNAKGQLLVQRRTRTKDWYPGILDFAAGGVVQHGEDYDLSAQRELAEELGIDVPLTRHFKLYFEDRSKQPITHSWGTVYSCISDGPFILQPEEVDEVEFMNMEAVLQIDPHQVTPDSRLALQNFML